MLGPPDSAEASAQYQDFNHTLPTHGCLPLLMPNLCLQPAVQSIKLLSRLDDEWFVMFCPSVLLPKKRLYLASLMLF